MFSARREEDLYDRGLLRYWEQRHPNFHYVPTLTRQRVPGMCHGRIPDILGSLVRSLRDHSVFVAGRQDFVDACVSAVSALGAPGNLLHTEGFHEQ